jgi:hypothetical protein
MSNLFREYVESKPVRASLAFGHNTNIIIASVDFEERKGKETAIKANTFITFQQIDPITRVVKAKFESSFWNLDPTSDFTLSNFDDQLTTMVSIVEAVGGSVETFVTTLLDATELEDFVLSKQFLSTKKNCKLIQDGFQSAFKAAIEDKIGDACPLLQCKIISNKKGFLEMGREAGWIIPMDSEESLPEVTAQEQAIYTKAQSEEKPTQAEPDAVGAAPSGEKAVATPTFANL